MNKQRERLVELLWCANMDFNQYEDDMNEKGFPKEDWDEYVADYLLEDGVIVPPCKVGDKVYAISSVFDESTLESKKVVKTRVIDFISSPSFLIESRGLIMAERDFGKTVFLTREEAEQALKGGAE